jgi:site-specific DNA-methyltransferase (adenine-specific)/modification methylase
MSYKRKEVIGDAVLYLGDCLEVMPTLGKVDAVVTDPPYGIGAYSTGKMGGGVLAKQSTYDATDWDDKAASIEQIQMMRQYSDWQIIFGGNYFNLPPARCWLIWDKENGNNNFADCEMAWTNLDKAVRLVRWLWHGMIRKGDDVREHPTQKPEGVMRWCINHLPDNAQTILDPFMGSGTTGVACVNLGRKFIGIELEEKYFDIACKRIDQAQRQGKLFTPPKPKPEQGSLL